MAVLPDYVTGTITLANGSTTVTGTGTMFTTAAFRPGDTLYIQNLTAIIASVNSNTSLTLTVPWTGTSLTNEPYRARYLPDGERVTAQTTTLIELLGSGNVLSFAQLKGDADQVPVFTGPGQMGLMSFSESAQNVISRIEDRSIFILVTGQSNATLERSHSWTVPNNLMIWNYNKTPGNVGTAFVNA
ncbi:hypothetical protein [Brucella cytisi]|uniref:hypothetical protein n=1 Tax=Brucella cytisi TaxID=407152 RepID=UPI00313BEF36